MRYGVIYLKNQIKTIKIEMKNDELSYDKLLKMKMMVKPLKYIHNNNYYFSHKFDGHLFVCSLGETEIHYMQHVYLYVYLILK